MKLIIRNNIATFVDETNNNFEDKFIAEDGTMHMNKSKFKLNMKKWTQEQINALDEELPPTT